MALTYSLRYLGSGPLFHQQLVAPYVEPCRTHFWYHLLLVHNFLPIDQRVRFCERVFLFRNLTVSVFFCSAARTPGTWAPTFS